jgi:MFS family permease
VIRCLRIVAFRRLFAAYVLNELAWSVGTLALSLLVYRETGSAIGSAGFFLSAQFLPALLAPALVARLDRASVRIVLPILYVVESLLFAALAYLAHHFLLVPVLVLALADGAIAATARSLATAARVEILRPRDLMHEGNALGSFAFSGAYMAGPLIGGAVVAAGGTVAALLVNCGLFATVGAVLAITALPGAKPEPGSAWPTSAPTRCWRAC